jgi:hypothetical protein
MTTSHHDGAPVTAVRHRLRPSDRRLLLGYGPAIVIAALFLLVTLLAPTIAPEQVVSPVSGSGAGAGTATGLPAASTATTVPGGASPSAAASGASTTGVVTACSGPQVSGDPYSPPCVKFSGNNGGATSPGVTGSTITVSYRVPADGNTSVNEAIQQIAGKYNSAAFSDTEADIERTLQDLVTYFNDHFQFYGRKIVLKEFNGQGSLQTELEDGGQAQANADALTAADTVGAFADVSALSQPYSQALSADHVVNIGAPYMSQQYFEQNAPYAWSFFPDCTDLGSEAASIAVKQLVNQNVTWAGTGVSGGQPRKIATLAPDNPVYQQCTAQVTSALQSDGHPVAANISYTLDFSELSQEAASIEQQIVNDKITTVICGCDPITLIYLTGDLDNARYEPEFFNIGAAFTDEDLLAQLFDQGAWAEAAGVTNNSNAPPYGSSLGYFAAKSVDPNNPPAQEVDIIYEDLYILALGVQLAGPDLTPGTLEKGLFNYPGGDGEYGPWSFNVGGTGQFTPQHEFRYEWYNPSATSSSDGEQGTWVSGSTWYTPATVPAGPAPVFPNGVQ